jgi:SAM-dependent methyltransferase
MKNEDQWKPSRVVKIKNDYKIIKEKYGLCSRYIGELVLPHYAKTIKKYAQGNLLDCGCGQAPYYIIYRDLVSSTTCIDWDVADAQHDYLDFTADLNKPLDMIHPESFDTILLADVIEHLHSPEILFSEAQRILKPGGRIIVFVPFFYWIHSEPHDYFRYTEFSLSRFCDINELEIIKLEPYGGYFDIMFDLHNKFFTNSEFGYKILRRFQNG